MTRPRLAQPGRGGYKKAVMVSRRSTIAYRAGSRLTVPSLRTVGCFPSAVRQLITARELFRDNVFHLCRTGKHVVDDILSVGLINN